MAPTSRIVAIIAAFANLHPVARTALEAWFERPTRTEEE